MSCLYASLLSFCNYNLLNMATRLWRVTAKRDNGKVKKGMNTEVLLWYTNAKPNSKQIAEVLNIKYGENIHASAVNVHFFELNDL